MLKRLFLALLLLAVVAPVVTGVVVGVSGCKAEVGDPDEI